MIDNSLQRELVRDKNRIIQKCYYHESFVLDMIRIVWRDVYLQMKYASMAFTVKVSDKWLQYSCLKGHIFFRKLKVLFRVTIVSSRAYAEREYCHNLACQLLHIDIFLRPTCLILLHHKTYICFAFIMHHLYHNISLVYVSQLVVNSQLHCFNVNKLYSIQLSIHDYNGLCS